MDRDNPDYSIIIPAYNCARTLPAAIASIRGSGLRNYEIIVVDDGSTDETCAVLDRLARENGDLVAIHQQNGGVSSARNRGLQAARGAYLLFLDADDLMAEGTFSEIASIIASQQPDMLLFGMWFENYHLGVCYQTTRAVSASGGLLSAEAWVRELDDLFRCNYLSPIWNKVIRRSVVTENGIRFAEDMFVMEDCRFSLDCLQFCQTIYLLPEPIYHYKTTDDGKKAAARVRRIVSLSAYLEHFLCLPETFSGVIRAIDRMLLLQRIRTAKTVDQLREEAEDCSRGPFPLGSAKDPEACKALLAGDYRGILRRNRKRRIRHRFAVAWKTLIAFFRGKPKSNP